MPDDIVIIFAYHFPPENAIGALRPFRFYKYLTRLGYQCHVITAANVGELREVDGRTVEDPFVTKARQGMGWQVERAIRRFLLPGVVGTQWALHAYRAALEYIEANPGARITVFSSFPPVGVHVAAYWLARRKRLPWIADFRDPLADNPVYEHISPFTKNVYRRLEKIFVEAADIVIANTDAAQQKLKRAYRRRSDRIQLIWNGFDPEQRLKPLPIASSGRRVFAHVGELYGGRSAKPLLESVRRLIDAGKASPAEFEIRLAGPVVPGSIPDADFVNNGIAEGWLRITDERIAQKDAHHIIQTAHGLVLIQWQSMLQVPGKLYEYLQLGRPILAMVPQNSPVERILSRSGVPYQCIYPSATLDEFDRGLLQYMHLPSGGHGPNEWFESQFNALSHAQKVSDLIQLAHGSRAQEHVFSEVAQD
jgi:hypothetical protein